jgi:apolipoprotein N-acyltransferase
MIMRGRRLGLRMPAIPEIATAIKLASGWRRRFIAFAAGAAGALAMAPINFFPALIIPMTVAIWLIDGEALGAGRISVSMPAAVRRAFVDGWWWGFGYFVASFWWLGAAFLVEADEFAWAMPLGVAGLPALLAVFPGFGFMLARLIWTPGVGRLFALAAALSFSEWLRGHVLTGFPWNTLGMALGGNLVTAQLASIIGLYGLTVVAILIFSAPAVLGEKSPIRGARGRVPPAILAATLAFGGICAFGAWRLAQAMPPPVAGVRLRIMQPNLPQDAKFRPENKAWILNHYLDLSIRESAGDHLGLDGVTALIWPESAFPFIVSRDARALAIIGAVLPPDTVLVTGAAREEDRSFAAGRPAYFNAIQIIASGGHILESYDKMHLVPFGEYLPFQRIFDRLGLHQFVHVPGGFEAGAGPRILLVPGLPAAAPLICYEAIFPGEAVSTESARERPGLLLNVTNDGWFGTTAGPYQHFAQARLRAIEEGLPLVRAANTGISAIVDPYGRVEAELPLGTEGILDGKLPQPIAPPFFANFPFATAFALWAAVLFWALAWRFSS